MSAAKQLRAMVVDLFAAIDDGTIDTNNPDFETEMLALGALVLDFGLRDLVPQVAMRTANGRAVMKKRGMLQ